jgi:hypothetical protein
MSTFHLDDIVAAIPNLDMDELRALEMSLQVAIRIRGQDKVGDEYPDSPRRDEDGPDLNDQALAVLEDSETFDLSLAEQALLASLVLSEGYQQDAFSSRDINDIVAESGRGRISHITSAVTGLLERAYLSGSTKSLSLSREGRAKARGLIGMLRRKAVT